MQNINYINNNKTTFKTLSKTAKISLLAIASCFVSSMAQAAPLNNWSANSTVTDCFGTSSYGQSSTSCQSYANDLYENWNPNDGGAGDTDIKTFSVGSDGEYFYFEIDLRQSWDNESRQYYLELANSTSGYFLVYQPKEDDLDDNGWKNKGNSGEVEVYTGSSASGYNSDLSGGKNLQSGDFYVRLVNGNVQMALKKSKIGSPNTISARAYASQNSTLEKDKVQWNQHNTQSDLSGFGGFDNTTWLSSNPTPPAPAPIIPPTTTTYLAD